MKQNPLKPAEFGLADIHAVRAVSEGRASEEQQRRAIKWIIECACKTYEHEFVLEDDSGRLSAFSGGKRAVGLQLVTMINLSGQAIQAIFKNKNGAMK